MVKSMTGYGKSETSINDRKITVEVRSLNGKQLDMSVKMPSAYRRCEYDIRGEATRRIQRGKADMYISCEALNGGEAVSVNKAAFAEYFRQVAAVCGDMGINHSDPSFINAIAPALLRMPEVVKNEGVETSEEEIAALQACVREALDRFDGFRSQEGEILINDLLTRVSEIESLKLQIEPFEKARTEAVKNRIRENIESIGIPFDSNRLEQEMIYYIEKLDVTEEKVRLSNHCRYFREVAAEEEGVGRKLGFIAQEMGREINTLGSKANDASIQRIVVRMKDELEKIKEQLLNIL